MTVLARKVEVRRSVLEPDWHRLGELAGGVHVAEEHIGDRVAVGLPGKPELAALRQSAVVTGDPVLKVTTTRGLTAETARNRFTWFAGSSMLVRSRPSASAAGGRPRNSNTKLLSAASATASCARVSESAFPSSAKPGENVARDSLETFLQRLQPAHQPAWVDRRASPWYRGVRASSPMTAIDRSRLGSSGRRPPSL